MLSARYAGLSKHFDQAHGKLSADAVLTARVFAHADAFRLPLAHAIMRERTQLSDFGRRRLRRRIAARWPLAKLFLVFVRDPAAVVTALVSNVREHGVPLWRAARS